MKVEDIDVSLRYGKLLNKGWIIFSYIVLGLLTLLLSYCVYDTYSSTRNIIDILYIVFSFVLIFAAYIWIILKYKTPCVTRIKGIVASSNHNDAEAMQTANAPTS